MNYASSAQNIRFKDGSIFGGGNTEGGNVANIYQLAGTASQPLVKVVISSAGQVRMYASKTSGGPLYELELFNGNSFNTFTWNEGSKEDNTIKITQLVDGRTVMKGIGRGKKRIACPM